LKVNFGKRALTALAALMLLAAGAVAGDEGRRRGEIGLQVGARWLDGDIVPDDSSGVSFAFGIEGAWSLSHKWAIFGDANTSEHDSIEMCEGSEGCYARTPVVRINMLTLGVERRFKSGPKGGQWMLGLGSGMEDLRWNGIRIHHGILSLNFSRRFLLGPGAARITLRADTSFSGRTDNQIKEGLDDVRITNVSVLFGWGFGFGGRF
jgi:hypothetical protein